MECLFEGEYVPKIIASDFIICFTKSSLRKKYIIFSLKEIIWKASKKGNNTLLSLGRCSVWFDSVNSECSPFINCVLFKDFIPILPNKFLDNILLMNTCLFLELLTQKVLKIFVLQISDKNWENKKVQRTYFNLFLFYLNECFLRENFQQQESCHLKNFWINLYIHLIKN